MKCCICGKEIKGYGNNPWPVNNKKNSYCCDECNYNYVVPTRIALTCSGEKGDNNNEDKNN